MRLYLDGDQLLLDCAPLDAAAVRRNTKYKMRCRRYDIGDGPDGTIELRMPANHIAYREMAARLEVVAGRLGATLAVDPALQERFEAMRELAEEHYRLGNEVKRHDEKHEAKFEEFAAVVNDAMVRPLKERQMWDAFFMATMARAGNFSVPGSGKTATVLGAFAFLAERGKVRRILVVCPKNAFESWEREWVACFGAKRPLTLFTSQDDGFKTLGRADRKAFVRTGVGSANLLLVNYEATPSIAEELASVASADTLLVYDEVHRVKRVGGKWAAACLTIAQGAPFTFALTGTPLPNTYKDLHNFLHILYPHEYDAFFGFDPGELEHADDDDQRQINEKLQPFYCRTTKQDLGVPPASPDQVVEIDADEQTSAVLHVLKLRYRGNALLMMLRVLQLESDPTQLLCDLDPASYRWLLDDTGEDEDGGRGSKVDVVDHSGDIDKLIRAIDGSQKRRECERIVGELVGEGKPVIVWAIFKRSMRLIRADLAAAGIEARVVDGSVTLDDRTAVLEDFRAGRFPVLITNPHTLAESVSLHSVCHDAVYFEYSFNLVHLLQSKDRIHRLGLPAGQDTNYYFLAQHYDVDGEDYSMDGRIYERLCEKEATMLRAIDMGLIETQPTTEEDLAAIFEGLF